MIGHNESEGIEPRNRRDALGESLHFLEARTVVCVKGEYAAACRGLSPWQVYLTDYIGTWESHTALKEASNKLKRQGGSMVVWQSD
jgi:hypothetical protein